MLCFAEHGRAAFGTEVPELVRAGAVGLERVPPRHDYEVLLAHLHVGRKARAGCLAAHLAMAVVHEKRAAAYFVADLAAET